MPRQIFVPARGQYDNIGDIVLRRQLLTWLRDNGQLHVYVGKSPEGYDAGLQLRPGDIRYRSFVPWYLAAIGGAVRGSASYVFKPGEIQLTVRGMKEHLAMLPVLALVRARRGAVVRVGVGARNFSRLPRMLMGPSVALSSVSFWRDTATADYLGCGEIMPDLAFGETVSPSGSTPEPDRPRDVLIVSMRSDRPYPSAAWREAVRQSAERRGLQIWAVTQVLRDDDRSARLAEDLGGRSLRWDGTAHDRQEARLRSLYRRAALAVSDRLHILVVAATEGAVPVALTVDSSDKIARHFAAAGIFDITVPTAHRSAQEIAERVDELLARRAQIAEQVVAARVKLQVVRARIGAALGSSLTPESLSVPPLPPASPRLTAIHVGRRGEVAGGMTQVLNGYLSWTFDEFDTRVIASRDGSKGLRAALLAAAAAWRIVRMNDRQRTVIVVHLSQGGSFVREGALLLLARARGFATVAQLHGSTFAAFAGQKPVLVGRVLRAADIVLTLSAQTSEIARQFVPGDAVVSLPNAVPSGTPRPKEKIVVFGGAISHRKGVDVLATAWQALRDQRPDDPWTLVLAGPTIDSDVVPTGLDGAEFVGPLGHDALMALLERSSVAVLPSRHEAMPMFLLEAMARGNCIVSTRVGGIPSVLGSGSGVLVSPGDAAMLQAALEKVTTDANFRHDIVRRAEDVFAATYSAAAVFPQLERVWKSALELRSHRKGIIPPLQRRPGY
ncbi:MAG: hypothetical protein JWQ68_2446 [Cryobacterium sp.]|nr:hypothetical protein [Cryobacterium sp.]